MDQGTISRNADSQFMYISNTVNPFLYRIVRSLKNERPSSPNVRQWVFQFLRHLQDPSQVRDSFPKHDITSDEDAGRYFAEACQRLCEELITQIVLHKPENLLTFAVDVFFKIDKDNAQKSEEEALAKAALEASNVEKHADISRAGLVTVNENEDLASTKKQDELAKKRDELDKEQQEKLAEAKLKRELEDKKAQEELAAKAEQEKLVARQAEDQLAAEKVEKEIAAEKVEAELAAKKAQEKIIAEKAEAEIAEKKRQADAVAKKADEELAAKKTQDELDSNMAAQMRPKSDLFAKKDEEQPTDAAMSIEERLAQIRKKAENDAAKKQEVVAGQGTVNKLSFEEELAQIRRKAEEDVKQERQPAIPANKPSIEEELARIRKEAEEKVKKEAQSSVSDAKSPSEENMEEF